MKINNKLQKRRNKMSKGSIILSVVLGTLLSLILFIGCGEETIAPMQKSVTQRQGEVILYSSPSGAQIWEGIIIYGS